MRRLKDELPKARCVVLTSFNDDEALGEALDAGAKAYLLKSVRGAEIADVVRAAAAGRTLLDERTVTRRRETSDDPTLDLTPSEHRALERTGYRSANK